MKVSKGTICAIAIVASLFASTASAQSDSTGGSAPKAASKISPYVGGGFSLYSGGEDARFSAGTIRGGIMFTPNFGAEIEYSKGLGESDDISSNFGNVKFGLDSQVSGFLVGRLPINDQTNVFGRLGYSTATVDVTLSNFSNSTVGVELQDVIWGIGGEYYFNDRIGVRGEVTGFKAEADNVDGGLDIFTISLVAKF
jgi:Outer membrane protein beta-barrel domain